MNRSALRWSLGRVGLAVLALIATRTLMPRQPVGGVITSSLLTLVVVPMIYSHLDDPAA